MPNNSYPQRIEVMEEQLAGLRTEFWEFRAEMTEFKAEITEFRADTAVRFTRVHADIEETRRQMRVPHEAVIGRISLLQEGLATGRRRRKPRS